MFIPQHNKASISTLGSNKIKFLSLARPHADVPSILKCLCDEPRMRLGEPLAADIIISATDKHGNKTGKVSSNNTSDA